jgi:hypothetical protein
MKDGLPKNPLARLLIIRRAEGFFPNIPPALQKAVFSAAYLIAHITGYDRRLAHVTRECSSLQNGASAKGERVSSEKAYRYQILLLRCVMFRCVVLAQIMRNCGNGFGARTASASMSIAILHTFCSN